MNTKEAKQSVQMDKALFDFYGKPSIGQSLPLAIQHVLAMIVGCVTPSIIVAGVAGLSQEDSVILIQAALVMSALTTLIQLLNALKLAKPIVQQASEGSRMTFILLNLNESNTDY